MDGVYYTMFAGFWIFFLNGLFAKVTKGFRMVFMEVLEQSSQRLVLRYRPLVIWFIGAILIGVIPLLLFGLAFLNTWIFYVFWFPLIPLFSLIAGCFLLHYTGAVMICCFDKNSGFFTWQKCFFRQVITLEYSLRDIIDVELDTRKHQDITAAPMVVVLRSGHAFFLNLDRDCDAKDKQIILNLIRGFLGLPPKSYLGF